MRLETSSKFNIEYREFNLHKCLFEVSAVQFC